MKKLVIVLLTLVCALALTGCEKKNKIIIGASSTPHAEILEFIKADYEALGYTLEIRVFNDYVTPNLSLESGDIQMNYFQHEPYLNDFNEKNGTNIVSVAKIHFEPMGIYKGTKGTLEEYQAGDRIAVPNDASNKDRAIELLEALGITGYTLVEMEAQTIPMVLQDVEYAIINGNYALASGVASKVIATEDKNSTVAQKTANIIAVKSGNENEKYVQDLLSVLMTEKVKQFILNNYNGSVLPIW